MKITMLTGLSGQHYSLSPRDVVEHPDAAEAQRLIDAGYAEEADADAKVTKMIVVPDIETATAVKPARETRKAGK